jgi:hypothetical protein
VNSGCDSLHSKPIVIKALPPCATKGLISLYDFSLSTILFDLDGTLVDTAPDLAYALNALLLENGVEEKSYKLIKP